MNERIQELADEAKMSTYLLAYGVEFNISIEKFAELIVKECAGRVDHILRERRAGGGTMGDDIREHFGVTK